jgi:hypothetical protein
MTIPSYLGLVLTILIAVSFVVFSYYLHSILVQLKKYEVLVPKPDKDSTKSKKSKA